MVESARITHVVLSLALVGLVGCTGDSRQQHMKLLSAEETGVTFANTITTSDSLNVQTDVYVYNGAGVAVGDIDNDGLPDLFFSGNMVSSRLYRNKGQMKFEDITEKAGVGTKQWATGATMVDINNDGYLDIYVSVSGPEWSKPESRPNRLFVNNKNGTFTESAAQYGIADSGYTTHAAFLDYDGDGCLDLFVLNNSPGDFSRSTTASLPRGMRSASSAFGYNQLYRNSCQGHFTNVSEQAGILRQTGYGLGVAIADVNRDGWPDIYVSNDVVANDVLYINTGNGTFTDRAARSIKHSSFAGMGVDIADFNNDGWPDVLQVDMLPRTLERRKRTLGFATYKGVTDMRAQGVRDDYSINSLQLSNGRTADGDVVFSEIARLAGVSQTDWSWSALFADFDNDGFKDVFIGNGYPKAVNDLDYMTTTSSAMRPGPANAARRTAIDNLNRLPSYEEINYFFRNDGDLTFSDKTKDWGVEKPSFSYGAAYADLDNDGTLDLVVNNIDAPAFIYQNLRARGDSSHYLSVRLDGAANNRRGIGATLILTAGGRKQYIYQSPYRGFMSTVDDRAHFGLGRAAKADSLEIFWPDGRYQLLTGVAADRTLIVKHADATETRRFTAPSAEGRRFESMSVSGSMAEKHETTAPIDYSVQSLLPYMISRHGPVIATADVDGDGLDDVFLGGGAGVPRQLYLQRKDGSFTASAQPWAADSLYEDWSALFFDANGDKRPDLYVASGGYQLTPGAPLLQDRLYINDGKGRFRKDTLAIPAMLTSKGVVRAADFNGDGRLDLFVGGRLTPRMYPAPTRSYLLRNDGSRFTDVTTQIAPELSRDVGMITDAVWIDFDGDSHVDLVTAGEWMPVQFYRNVGGRFSDVTAASHLTGLRGWWFSLAAGDFDKDGRPDLVAGNLGLNYSYTTSSESRFGVYAGDFTGNRSTDVVLTQHLNGTEYPLGGMVPLGREIYLLGLKFPTYAAFANASVRQLFDSAQLRQAIHLEADTFASVFLHNDGGGAFSWRALPNAAQIAPIKAGVSVDVDGDGNLDLIVAGNIFDTEPNTARADAGNGLWLRGDGKGHFTPVSPFESGFLAPRNVSGLALINTPSGRAVLVANTGDSLQAFHIRK